MNAVASSAGVAPKKPSEPVPLADLFCCLDAVRRASEDLQLALFYVKDNQHAKPAIVAAGHELRHLREMLDRYSAKGGIPA